MTATQPLAELVHYVRGVTFKPEQKQDFGTPGSLVCMRTANIQQTLDLSDVIAVPASVSRDDQKLRPGDILISSANSWNLVGKCVPVPKLPYDATAGGFISIVRPNGQEVDPAYLYRWMSSGQTQHRIRQCANKTTNISNLSVERFLALEAPVPPLAEQRRVAAMLDKADGIRRKRRESLKLLDDLLRSAFLEMFGRGPDARNDWDHVTVRDLQAKVPHACAGGPFGSSLTRSDYIDTPGVPVIRGTNLTLDGTFRDEGFVFVSETKAVELRRNIARPGDIVFTQRGTLGQVARIPDTANYRKYVVSQSQMKLTADDGLVDPTYLVHYFLSPGAAAHMASRQLATGVPHINLGILLFFPVPLPPLALQRRFASVAVAHTGTRDKLEKAQGDADRLFDSLAQRAFGG